MRLIPVASSLLLRRCRSVLIEDGGKLVVENKKDKSRKEVVTL